MIDLQSLQRIIDRRLAGILAKLEANIRRCVIKLVDDDAGVRKVQAQIDSDETTYDDTPHLQPFGFSVLPPAEAEAVRFQFGSAPEDEFIAFAHVRTARPRDLTEEGTGGLHYLGEWKVYIDENGNLNLGAKEPTDFVALASKVDGEIARIWDTLTGFTPVMNDGGAALKAKAQMDELGVQAVGSATVKAAD